MNEFNQIVTNYSQPPDYWNTKIKNDKTLFNNKSDESKENILSTLINNEDIYLNKGFFSNYLSKNSITIKANAQNLSPSLYFATKNFEIFNDSNLEITYSNFGYQNYLYENIPIDNTVTTKTNYS